MRILTVDDSKIMRQMVRATLETSGKFQCMEAEDGLKALALLNQASELPSLILMDVNMPNLDGLELTKKLRQDERFRYTPIVMLTTEEGDDLKKIGQEIGATGWITKPFNPQRLLQVVCKLVG